MVDIPTDINSLREGWDCEAKMAAGRDGRGQVPASLWETYSAMANTEGGIILLGVQENQDGHFRSVGIPDIDRVERDFWNQVNDSDKVNRNLLRRQDVERAEIDGRTILVIRVPQAERQQRPVFLNGNPLKGTYVRRHDGDHRASDEDVRRLLAEADALPRDGEILDGYGLDDLDPDSLAAFRNLFRSQSPGHPFLAGDDREMLRQLGGWGRKRISSGEGPTLAGLLMFGRQRSILDRLPAFHLDYQHLPEPSDPVGMRWIDRVTPDGTWPGNLFEFYRKVVPKLRDGVRIPFQLGQDLLRRDDTPQHEALRESLVNALIHTDHTGRGGIRIRRAPNRFEFVNPGTLRIPREQVRIGGRSDCRNPAIQRMFQMIGAGEKAGSGFPRIVQAWREQHWRTPLLEEDHELYETRLTLTTLSLFPVEVVEDLEHRFPGRLASLDQDGRLALATALLEGRVSNNRLQELTERHPSDLTEMLRRLVREGFLESHGKQRWTWYSVYPGVLRESAIERFVALPQGSVGLPPSSVGLPPDSVALAGESVDLPRDLLERADAIRARGKVDKGTVCEVILALCEGRHISLRTLSGLLGRVPDYLRWNFVRELVQSGQLEPLYPDKPNHPEQAYRTRTSSTLDSVLADSS